MPAASFSVVRLARCLVIGLILALSASAPLIAQDEAAAGPGIVGDADPATFDVTELRLRLLPLRREQLSAEADLWMERVKTAATEYVQFKIESIAPDADETPDQIASAQAAQTEVSRLIDRYNAVLASLQQKGGDVAEHKQYAARMSAALAAPVPGPKGPGAASVSVPKLTAYNPLIVSADELKLRMRSHRRAELEEEVEAWLQRLETKTEQIVATDIAARELEGEEQESLIALSTKLKEERSALVERTNVVIGLLEIRGGTADEARQYVKAISGGLVDDLSSLDGSSGTAITAWNTVVAWSKSKEGGQKVLTNVGKFLAILVIAWIFARILGRIAASSLKRFGQTSVLLSNFVVKTTRRLVMIIGVVIAVSKLGVNIGPLIAAIGAAGLVIGLALQGTLSNFASGILILLYRPFDVGDVIEAGGVMGKVEAMTTVSTTIITPDNQLLVVPNNSVWGNVIRNITGRSTRRVDLVFGIGYEDDIEKSRAILEEVVFAHDKVLDTPEPVIKVHELADSSVNFIVRPWAKTEDYWDVYWDVTRKVKERFDAEGVSIPFPQRDVHVHTTGGDGSVVEPKPTAASRAEAASA